MVRELFPRLTGGIRWGLERTRRMLAAAGDPHEHFRSFHVGGTNGKGSVAATLASVLRQAGHHTGLYTSPHLCTFRERIQIQGDAITAEALLAAAQRLWPVILEEQPTFFEATTAIAFLALADAGVDVAVIEVGLGGRLDSTNVIHPDVVALTNVSLDHVQLLGNSLEAVAGEKAGIIKAGVPVVTAEAGGVAARVFAERAVAVGAPIELPGPERVADVVTGLDGTRFTVCTRGYGTRVLHTPLIGAHQAVNTALAVAALDIAPPALRPPVAAVEAGIAGVLWPGRLQIERVDGGLWVFDVAHNVAGVESLVAALRALPLAPPLVAVVGVLGDKDWRGMLGPLGAVADAVVLTLPPTAPPDRRWDPHAVLLEVPLRGAIVVTDFAVALRQARDLARREGGNGTVVVTGSFHTVGDALIALDRAPFGADAHLPVPSFAI